MEQRSRSPRYPSMPLDEAIELSRQLYAGDGMNTVDREVAVEHMGYSSLNGASAQALASLSQYGLIENAGKGQVKLTSTALDIIEPTDASDKVRAMEQAAWAPKLFADLREKFPDTTPSESNLRAHLIRQQFQQSALKLVVPAYRRTCEYVTTERESESYGQEAKRPQGSNDIVRSKEPQAMETQSVMPAAVTFPPQLQSAAVPSINETSTLRREVFGLEEGEVVITLPSRLSAESVMDIEDWLKVVTKKIKRMANVTRASTDNE